MKLIDNIQLVRSQPELIFNPWDRVLKELDNIVFNTSTPKEERREALAIINRIDSRRE